MSDEELLVMYRKYKKKRTVIILIIIVVLVVFAVLGFKLFYFNNTSSNSEEMVTPDPIVVKDKEAPIIKLKTDAIEILKGDNIKYLEYVESVNDNIDGNLIEKIEYQEIDTSILEKQSIVYSVSDSSGNISQEVIKVIIKEKPEDKPTSDNSNSAESTPPKETTTPPKQPTTPPKENTPSKNETPTTQQPPEPPKQETPEKKPTEKVVKYFLFSDGYTMANVAEACASELRKTNRTGMCSPLQNENGIYLGMKLETN